MLHPPSFHPLQALRRLLQGCVRHADGSPRSRLSCVLRLSGLLAAVGLLAAAVTLAVLWPRCSGADCPSVEALRDYTPSQASRVFDRKGKLLAHLAPERRIVVPLEKIPRHVRQAFLAVEDRRFYEHAGIDYRRAVGALVRDLQTLRYDQGFSTLTMQLARNVFPEHLTRAKTLRRKLWEVVLAREIERAFSKNEILELYLNQIYLGEGLYGIEAAAQGYFGKSVAKLSLAEAALLAALPKAPSYYSPRRNLEAAVRRRNLVLSLMAAEGLVPRERAEKARAEPVRLVPPQEARGEAPYFVEAVSRELVERFGPDAANAGLRVYTGLDRTLQRAAETQLVRQIEAVEKGRFGAYRHPACASAPAKEAQKDAPAKDAPAKDAPKETAARDAQRCLQGLYVALDPHTGDVLALVGGRDYALSQFDRVTQAKRQGGSVFKPVVWAAAIGAGLPVSTPLTGPGVEELSADPDSREDAYRPADHVADTEVMNLREGLLTSSNRAAVALGERVGVERVVETARALGLSTPIPAFPSTFLGAADVIPLEMVTAYAPFTNGGYAVRPRLIQRVEDAEGQVLWQPPVHHEPVLPPAVAYLTLNLLEDVVARGTAQGVRAAGLPASVPAAGKTGTTNEAADVWFIGATPDLVAGVWLGFDKPERILHGASGGRLAAPVWGRVAAEYYRGRKPPAPWPVPGELVARDIDRTTGLLANPGCPPEHIRPELFLPGTEPFETCTAHDGGLGGWLKQTFDGIGGWFVGGGRPQAP